MFGAAARAGFDVTDISVSRADARDRVHRPHREGPARMKDWRTSTRQPESPSSRSFHPERPRRGLGRRVPRRCCCATRSCCARTLGEFIPRTLLQPFLLVFVFTYVFPKIGQGVGGRSAMPPRAVLDDPRRRRHRAGDHVPGHPVGVAADGAGVRLHREIEDRVLAPLPIALVAMQKAVSGALSGVRLGARRVPDRRGRAGDARWISRSTGSCCSHSRRSPASWRRARPHVRHAVRAADGADAVRRSS